MTVRMSNCEDLFISDAVWICLSKPKPRLPRAYDYRGSLRLESGELVFRAKGYELKLDLNSKMTFGKYGTDIVNYWVKMHDGSGNNVYLCDARLLGWSGRVLGLRVAISRASGM